MATKYYDHLDDAPLSIRQKADNPSSAIPVSEHIATIEEKIAKDAEAPPQKKVKTGKVPVVKPAMLTSTNARLREEITQKSLQNTYKRRERRNIQNAHAVRLLTPAEADKVRQYPERLSRIMGSRW
eukprot:9125825-Pyramimonas_sp.AAC.1